jgi:DNA mismatch repair protein MutS2
MGIFSSIMIDIGDEQSIENDLSTYSSHLLNMKNMIRHANEQTLLLIDEFGTGTEPQIGGAIAESVLKQFCKKQAWGLITTHYQNLKHFAEEHEGVVNGAMLYDRHEMRPLFQLSTGRPGSSFAIEIARKTGLPEEVINDASEIVGSEYIQSDKYLQDIVRDKRYWEGKRQTIHQKEKNIERAISRYETSLSDIEQQRKAILQRAKEQA